MEEIKVSKFFITIPGDESVGIFDQQFTLEPDFYFEDQESLDHFKAEIISAFENAFGEKAYVETAEEILAREEMYILQTEQMLEDFDNQFEDDPIDDKKLRKMMDDDFNFGSGDLR
jgi:hypothetical protein